MNLDQGSSGLSSRLAPLSKDGKIMPSAYEANEVKNTLLKNANPKIQGCYNKWLETNPKFERGRLEVDWHIQPDGTVQKPEVVSTDLVGINDCVTNIIAQLKFPTPPSDRPVYVSHTFKFQKQTDSKP